MTVIEKIRIRNYRAFEDFSLDFTPELNILVGDNDVGKSTVLEAVNLALTFRLGDKHLSYVLSPYLFSSTVTERWAAAIENGESAVPPEILIDLFLEDDGSPELANLRGSNNLDLTPAAGIRIRVGFNPEYAAEYQQFIAGPDDVRLVPTEYYKPEWLGFSGNPLTSRSIPLKSSRIDASQIRLQSGADYYLQGIIAEHLEPAERVELARAYRSLRETFSGKKAIAQVNAKLAESPIDLTDRALSLSIDISQRSAWESNLVPHLDDLPFQFVGNGHRSMLKVLLALHRKADASQVVLIEEPENHLSPANLSAFIDKIGRRCAGRQVLVATHSSYVLNKLGLDRLLLIGAQAALRLTDLPRDTLEYFKRLAGYDTLRLVLANRAILVEGPSDELLIQHAYLAIHGKLPIERGVEVISVAGLSFKRFLDIAKPLGKKVAVITDLDKRTPDQIAQAFEDYADENITVHTGAAADGRTLEPQMISSNTLETLNAAFGTTHADAAALEDWMSNNKTTWALKIFESDTTVQMPPHIRDAVNRF